MDSKVWIEELENTRSLLEELARVICDKVKEICEEEDLKVITTYRVKGKSSLAEKIKRKNFECDANKDKSIYELLDDSIGVRIICMKISDEKLVYEKILENREKLSDIKINFKKNIHIQPTSQKNGHAIYKFHGLIGCESSDTKFPFELQIKSLANLFWGEMEHLLFYKNNKVLISNEYYEKEITSIYVELENIDKKLTYMEEIMMVESEDHLLKEKIEVFKRYAYLQLRDSLKIEFKEDLNNKYIFDAIGNYLFKTYKVLDENSNSLVRQDSEEILRKAMYIMLDKNKKNINISNFNFDEKLVKIYENDIKILVNDILSDRTNGWWVYLVLTSIYIFLQENINSEIPQSMSEIEEQLKKCINDFSSIINNQIYLYTQLKETEEINDKIDEDSNYDAQLKILTVELAKKFLIDHRDKKSLKFTEKDYAMNYNYYGIRLITELEGKDEAIIESFYENRDFIDCIHAILMRTNNTETDIEIYVKKLNEIFKEESIGCINEVKNYSVQSFFDALGGRN